MQARHRISGSDWAAIIVPDAKKGQVSLREVAEAPVLQAALVCRKGATCVQGHAMQYTHPHLA